MKNIVILLSFLLVFLISGCAPSISVENPYRNYTIYYTPNGIRFYTDGHFYYDMYGNRLYYNSYQIYNYLEYNKKYYPGVKEHPPVVKYRDNTPKQNDNRIRDTKERDRTRSNDGERNSNENKNRERNK